MWFTETPWPPIFIGIAVAAIAFGLWLQQRKRWPMTVAIAALLGCVLVFVVEWLIVTDGERVEQAVNELVQAVADDNVDRVVEHFGTLALKGSVRLGLQSYRVQPPVRVTDVQVRPGENAGEFISHFRANGTGERRGTTESHHFPTRWELTWKQIDGRWRVIAIQRLDPVNGERMGLLDPP